MLAIDLITKLVIMNNMVVGDSIPLIKGFLHITYSQNPNAAFGMGFSDPQLNRWLYIAIALIATGVILFFYIKKFNKYGLYIKACLMLILTGALGNVIDRLFYAKSNYCVVDWIDFCGIWGAIFNIADSCIVVGSIMLIVYLIVEEVKDYKIKKANEPKEETPVLSKTEQEKKDYDNQE